MKSASRQSLLSFIARRVRRHAQNKLLRLCLVTYAVPVHKGVASDDHSDYFVQIFERKRRQRGRDVCMHSRARRGGWGQTLCVVGAEKTAKKKKECGRQQRMWNFKYEGR